MRTRAERAQKFAQIWYKSRTDAGWSQEAMALELGISKKTVQNWEKGITAPDAFQGEEWFRVLGLNPMKYYLEFHYPALFPYDEDQHEESEVDIVLSHYLEQAKAENKAKLLWLIEGRKEYVWNSMLQMMMAHSLLSLESRAITAQTILDAFEIESESRGIEISDELMPDLELLKNSIEKAKDAAKANKKSIYGR